MDLWWLVIVFGLILPVGLIALIIFRRDKRVDSFKKKRVSVPFLEKEGLKVYITWQKDWLLTNAEPARIIHTSNPLVIVQEHFMTDTNMSYLEAYILREWFRRKHNMQIKIALGLFLPVWTVASILIWLYQISDIKETHPFLVNAVSPLAAVILLSVCLWIWNWWVGKQEQRADRELLHYYSAEQVKEFIVESEKREKKSDKTKAFDQHYLQKRLLAIEANNG